MTETENQYHFEVEKITKNGVQEGHGLMRQFFGIFMALYLSNALS